MKTILAEDPAITHVAMVHSETTSGILNDIQSVGQVVKEAGKVFIADAISSFAGVEIPVCDWGIDFLVSSANKCIQMCIRDSPSCYGLARLWRAARYSSPGMGCPGNCGFPGTRGARRKCGSPPDP